MLFLCKETLLFSAWGEFMYTFLQLENLIM